MNMIKKVMDYQKEQSRLILQNQAEIELENRKTLRTLLQLGAAAFILFLFVALTVESYKHLLWSYVVELVFLVLIFLTHDGLLKSIPSAYIIYAGYGTLTVYSIYNSAFITPDFTSVVILFFLFQLPIVTVDKSWRINLIEVTYAALYLFCAVPFKDARLIPDEILNCILFTSVSILLGEYMRKVKVENLDLKRQALIRERVDFLTGLGNRRCLYERFFELEDSVKERDTIGILMIDIDYFKRYNDTYGHRVGDECLRKVGKCLREFGEASAVTFYRYGGEEFVGVARSPSQVLSELGKGLNRAVFDLNIPHTASVQPYVTISVGVSFWNGDGAANCQTLLSQADQALYMAKAQGRNRTVVHEVNADALSSPSIRM